jgi:hypothetical protein
MKKNYYTVISERNGRELEFTGTLDELICTFGYTLEVGQSWEHEKGNHKINRYPKTIRSLINNLNWAKNNSAANGYSDTSYRLKSE